MVKNSELSEKKGPVLRLDEIRLKRRMPRAKSLINKVVYIV